MIATARSERVSFETCQLLWSGRVVARRLTVSGRPRGKITVFGTMARVGATGAVGRIMLQLLEERPMLAKKYRFLASARSAGSKLTFKGQEYTVELLEPAAFKGVDVVRLR